MIPAEFICFPVMDQAATSCGKLIGELDSIPGNFLKKYKTNSSANPPR
jgi:hypothetical protein